MKKCTILALALLISVLCVSCSKDSDKTEEPIKTPSITTKMIIGDWKKIASDYLGMWNRNVMFDEHYIFNSNGTYQYRCIGNSGTVFEDYEGTYTVEEVIDYLNIKLEYKWMSHNMEKTYTAYFEGDNLVLYNTDSKELFEKQ